MSERVFGVCLLVFCCAGLWIGWDLQAPISYEPIGPRAFPLLVLSLLAVCALALSLGGGTPTAWPPRAVIGRIVLLFGVLLAYALLFERLGFVVATTLATIPIARAFGATWRMAAVGGVGLGIGFFLLFDRLLDVVLPTAAWVKFVGL